MEYDWKWIGLEMDWIGNVTSDEIIMKFGSLIPNKQDLK